MSAIFGLIFAQEPPPKKHLAKLKTFFNTLAALSADRGTDSAGVVTTLSDGFSQFDKETISTYEFIMSSRWENILDNLADPKIFTVWGIAGRAVYSQNQLENAYPHLVGDVLGINAGRIDDSAKLNPDTPFNNDAKNLFHALAERKQAEWKDVMANVRGQYAMAIAQKDTFSVISESTSIVYIAEFKDLPYKAFAQSKHFLWAAGTISGFALEEIKKFPEHEIYTYRYAAKLPTGTKYIPKPYTTSYNQYEHRAAYSPIVPPETTHVAFNVMLGEITNRMCEQCHHWLRNKDTFKTATNKLICGLCKVRMEGRGIIGINPFTTTAEDINIWEGGNVF